MPQKFFYISEIAALLGYSKQWTGTLLRRGDIPGERIGKGRWRVQQVILKEYAKKNNISLDWDRLEQVREERRARREAAITEHKAQQQEIADQFPMI